MSHDNHERFEALLMQAIDEVLSASDQGELDAHLSSCDACRREFDEFQQIKRATDGMRQRILAEVEHNPIRPDLPTRAVNTLGLIALIFVALVGFGAGFVSIWGNHAFPGWLRVGLILSLGVGLLVFLNMAYRRIRFAPHDPYREIDR